MRNTLSFLSMIVLLYAVLFLPFSRPTTVRAQVQLSSHSQEIGEHVPGQMLVKFRHVPEEFDIGDVELSYGLKLLGLNQQPLREAQALEAKAQVRSQILNGSLVIAQFESDEAMIQGLATLSSDWRVEYVEPNAYGYGVHLEQGHGTRFNDPLSGREWYLGRISGLQTSADSGDVIIAHLGTGSDASHEDLQGQIDTRNSKNEIDGTTNIIDDNSSGTFDDGVVGALGNNGKGTVGLLNKHTRIVSIKCLDKNNIGSLSNLIQALNDGGTLIFANKGRGVISASWLLFQDSQSVKDVLMNLENRGILVFFPADSTGNDLNQQPQYPPAWKLDNVITVTGSTPTDALMSKANYGDTIVDLAAPGENIVSTVPGNRYATSSSTDYAMSFVVATAALVINTRDFDWIDTKDALVSSVDPVPALAGKVTSGGRLNVKNALTHEPKPRNHPPVVTITGPKATRAGKVATFTLTGTDQDQDNLMYSLDYGDQEVVSGTMSAGEVINLDHTYAVAGVYPVTASVSDGKATVEATTTVSVSLNHPPTADAGPPITIVKGESGPTLNGSKSSDIDGDPLTYHWTTDEGRVLSGVMPVPIFDGYGNHGVTLIVNDGQADSTPAMTAVTVTDRVTIDGRNYEHRKLVIEAHSSEPLAKLHLTGGYPKVITEDLGGGHFRFTVRHVRQRPQSIEIMSDKGGSSTVAM